MNNLDDDCISIICDFLPMGDLVKLSSTCQRLRQSVIFNSNMSNRHVFHKTNKRKNISDEMIDNMFRGFLIKHIDCSNYKVFTNKVIWTLAKSETIRSINFNNYNDLTDQNVKTITEL